MPLRLILPIESDKSNGLCSICILSSRRFSSDLDGCVVLSIVDCSGVVGSLDFIGLWVGIGSWSSGLSLFGLILVGSVPSIGMLSAG